MNRPRPSRKSWGDRMKLTLARWKKPRLPEAPTRVESLAAPCATCGVSAGTVVLAEYSDGWRFTFEGVAGYGNGGSRRISAEEAQAIRDALRPPYASAKIQAAGIYDDFGYCTSCEKFYCATHWQVSATGGGTCPAGHFKSLDPHWRPDWDDQ